MISALVINLDHSSERLEFQRKQLAHLQIPMQRLAAINSSDILIERYEQLANGWERKMRPAEVACFLSHKAAWQYVLDTGKPWLILEDDALLSHKIADILEGLVSRISEVDYVNLETRHRRKWLSKKNDIFIAGYELRQLYQDRTGAAAYILFPSGAQKLLNRAEHSAPALADAFLCRSYELNAWQVYPAAAIQLDQCINYGLNPPVFFVSTITPQNNLKPRSNNFYSSVCFKYRRLAAQIRMGWRQLSVLGYAQRMMVPIIKSDFEE
ncbi:glycosyltransferase family 25 protein [Snodgrassella sp. ESL0253]|uniref:glycosyltransferase family 25 protein n=1 Tax=Snodgrassella sp. ESL0253 TaxID=2705031 RepID=UPI001583C27F|nr:glycosyltransferase family 25 protein [Snodgrassella sp. ESL0253]NUE66037.1 glycosyltransferase family 25 protein [Snodgrassella sp. ESL0253]